MPPRNLPTPKGMGEAERTAVLKNILSVLRWDRTGQEVGRGRRDWGRNSEHAPGDSHDRQYPLGRHGTVNPLAGQYFAQNPVSDAERLFVAAETFSFFHYFRQ